MTTSAVTNVLKSVRMIMNVTGSPMMTALTLATFILAIAAP